MLVTRMQQPIIAPPKEQDNQQSLKKHAASQNSSKMNTKSTSIKIQNRFDILVQNCATEIWSCTNCVAGIILAKRLHKSNQTKLTIDCTLYSLNNVYICILNCMLFHIRIYNMGVALKHLCCGHRQQKRQETLFSSSKIAQKHIFLPWAGVLIEYVFHLHIHYHGVSY